MILFWNFPDYLFIFGTTRFQKLWTLPWFSGANKSSDKYGPQTQRQRDNVIGHKPKTKDTTLTVNAQGSPQVLPDQAKMSEHKLKNEKEKEKKNICG